MKRTYYGLTKLEVSFQCCVPIDILVILEAERALRRQTGMRGYAYRIDTENAVWHVSDSDNPALYNVIVSPSPLMLAQFNYEEIQNKLLEYLMTELNIIIPENNNTPLERIRRLDFSVDFISDSFTPDANNIYCPNRCKKKFKGNIVNVSPIEAVFLNRADTQEIIIGEMPYRQISIIKANPDIWRVTASAGKSELNKYELRRFSDIKNAPDIFISIFNDYRYVIPNNSKSRAHWPLAHFWKIAINSAQEYFPK